MPDDVFASIWEMFNFIVRPPDHIGQSRRHEEETVEYSLMRIFCLFSTAVCTVSDGNIQAGETALLHPRIFCCDHRPTPEYPSPRPRPMSRLTSKKSKCLYIARRLIEQLLLAYISTERTDVHVPWWWCSHKYQPAFRSLLNLCTIDR